MAAPIDLPSPLRIVILSPHAQVRSPLVVLTPLLADALQRRGCTVRIEPWGRRRESEPAGARVLGRAADIVRIRRRLRSEPCDVLLLQTAHDWKTLSRDIPLLWATRGMCARRVVHLHGCRVDRLVGAGGRSFKLASRLLLQTSDALLVLSREEQRQWQAFHPRTRVYVTRNPFMAPPTPSLAQPRSALGLPERVPVLLFVGRLVEWKGPHELLNAVAAMFARTPAHLLIVGDGPERGALQQRVDALGLTRSVTFAGHLAPDLLHAAYAAADVFVLPSRSEGFPTAILEAMAAGLPIVTTAIRGMADHLRDGVHGLLVTPGDAGALAAALEQLLADVALRGRMREVNRAHISTFAPDVVAAEQLAILEEIMRDPV